MLVKLNVKFFAKRRAPVSSRLAKKFGEIDPRRKGNFNVEKSKNSFCIHVAYVLSYVMMMIWDTKHCHPHFFTFTREPRIIESNM
jgi:hypothetical protein